MIQIVAGIVPMVIYATFLYWLDRHEREPVALVVSVFLWGFIPAALLSLVSQLIFSFPLLIFDPSGAVSDIAGAVLFAPITEEIFKGVAVALIFILLRGEFDSVLDGILYGGIVGFGFAAVENILYFFSTDVDLGMLIFLRAFLFGLNHAFYTSLIGIGFGIARHARQPATQFLAPLGGLVLAIGAHMFHNGSLVLGSEIPLLCFVTLIGDYIGIFGVFVAIAVALRQERQWIVEHLKEEVPATLSQTQYEVVSRPMRRFTARISALFNGGVGHWWSVGRYFETLVDLAYKKHAFERRGEKGAPSAVIDTLRTRAAGLSPQLAEAVK